MKKIGMILMMVLLTGCGKKDELVGKWTTKYELGMYGEITQIYEFHKNKTCKKTLITDMTIEKECTYKRKKDTIEIKYDDQEEEIPYRMEEDILILGGYQHTKNK